MRYIIATLGLAASVLLGTVNASYASDETEAVKNVAAAHLFAERCPLLHVNSMASVLYLQSVGVSVDDIGEGGRLQDVLFNARDEMGPTINGQSVEDACIAGAMMYGDGGIVPGLLIH